MSWMLPFSGLVYLLSFKGAISAFWSSTSITVDTKLSRPAFIRRRLESTNCIAVAAASMKAFRANDRWGVISVSSEKSTMKFKGIR